MYCDEGDIPYSPGRFFPFGVQRNCHGTKRVSTYSHRFIGSLYTVCIVYMIYCGILFGIRENESTLCLILMMVESASLIIVQFYNR